MNKAVVLCLSLLLAGSLAGCGKSQKQQQNTQNFQISVPGANASIGTKLPGNLPPYAEIYPGAQVMASVTGLNGDGAAGTITLQTDAAVPDVVEFYKRSMAKNGFSIKAEFTSGDVVTVAAEHDSKTISVVATKSDARTTIQLTYSQQ